MVKKEELEIAREDFMAELEAAKERVGSNNKLSFALKIPVRRIMYWRRGDGPTQKTMKEVLPLLKDI